jgi:flagellar motor protein MotB
MALNAMWKHVVLAAATLGVVACSSSDEKIAEKDRQLTEERERGNNLQRELEQSKSVQQLTQQQLEDERRKQADAEAAKTAPPAKDPAFENAPGIGASGAEPRPEPRKKPAAAKTKSVKDSHVETDARSDGSTMFRLKGAATFGPGSDKLTKDGLAAVDKIAAELKKSKGSITIEGHTDATPLTGKNKELYRDNMNLSIARASAVKERLVEHGKISADRISIVGRGDTKPLAKGTSKEANARNRRVEIILADE